MEEGARRRLECALIVYLPSAFVFSEAQRVQVFRPSFVSTKNACIKDILQYKLEARTIPRRDSSKECLSACLKDAPRIGAEGAFYNECNRLNSAIIL